MSGMIKEPSELQPEAIDDQGATPELLVVTPADAEAQLSLTAGQTEDAYALR